MIGGLTVAEWAAALRDTAAAVLSVVTLLVMLRTSRKVDKTHDLVNGQSHALQALSEAKGLAEGKLVGQPGVVGKDPQSEIGSSTH